MTTGHFVLMLAFLRIDEGDWESGLTRVSLFGSESLELYRLVSGFTSQICMACKLLPTFDESGGSNHVQGGDSEIVGNRIYRLAATLRGYEMIGYTQKLKDTPCSVRRSNLQHR